MPLSEGSVPGNRSADGNAQGNDGHEAGNGEDNDDTYFMAGPVGSTHDTVI